MIIQDNLLQASPQDAFALSSGSAKPKAGLKQPTQLLLRRIGTPTASSAMHTYLNGVNQAHLILGPGGEEIIQMAPFDRRVGSDFAFDRTSIQIALVGLGYLLEEPGQSENVRHISHHPPEERLKARGLNDHKYRFWPRFHPDQLELLVELTLLLIKQYKLKQVRTHEEVLVSALDPGPAFPYHRFIERLHHKKARINNRKEILFECKHDLKLHNGPGASFAQLKDVRIPKGLHLAVVDEQDGWSMVEAQQAIKKTDWHIGWVRNEALRVKPFQAVVRNHRLETDKGRAFPFIPAAEANHDTRENSNAPKYLIMHYTTGTQVRSTLNTFRNAANGVSTHLVIGRDGRVFQMVPFNMAAYHTGLSFWEGERRLNTRTIGIELDNAGRLSQVEGKWTKRGHIIPQARTREARHWKGHGTLRWERFPDVQLEVAFRVAEALKKAYDLEDILGHDQVNMKTRYDPGPLFPLEEWRQRLFGQKEPRVKVLLAKAGATVYEDFDGLKPDLEHPDYTGLKLAEGVHVDILQETTAYTLVKVKKGNKVAHAWLPNAAIKKLKTFDKIGVAGVKAKAHGSSGAPPPTLHAIKELPEGTRVRVGQEEGDMLLIVSLGKVGSQPFVEGWVKKEDLDPE